MWGSDSKAALASTTDHVRTTVGTSSITCEREKKIKHLRQVVFKWKWPSGTLTSKIYGTEGPSQIGVDIAQPLAGLVCMNEVKAKPMRSNPRTILTSSAVAATASNPMYAKKTIAAPPNTPLMP